MIYVVLLIGCSDILTAFNPDDERRTNLDCEDSGDCGSLDDSGYINEPDDSPEQADPFTGFSGYINQTFEFGSDYESQGYSDCTIDMTLQAAGEYLDGGCPNCDLVGESEATLTTSCSFAENATGTFRMGVDTESEIAYSYNDTDGWQPFFAAGSCNAGLDVSSTNSSLTVDCIYDADGYTQETNMNIRW